MKILYVINDGIAGGLQRHVLCLMQSLRGIAETAVAINSEAGPACADLFKGEKVYRLHGKSGHDPKIIGAFRKILDDFNPDVVHAHGLPLLVAVWIFAQRLFRTRRRSLPVIQSLHCPTLKPSLSERIANFFLDRMVDYWLPVSTPTWDAFRKWHPAARGEVFFNPLGDIAPRSKMKKGMSQFAGTGGERFIAGMAGRIADQKDWGSFCRVADILSASDSPLFFRGVGGTREEAASLLGEDAPGLGVVEWAGMQKDGREWIGGFDLFVMTSRHEQLPTVILECFAENTPVCGYIPDGGMTDILQFSDGTLKSVFIKERDPEKLAAIVRQIASDSSLRKAIADDGRRILEGHFDAAANCRGQLMDIYRRFSE